MKAYVWPADMWACGHYRLMWPARVIHDNEPDFEVQIVEPKAGSDTGLRAWMNDDNEVIGAACPDDADLVVFQRPSYPQLVHSIPYLRERGVAVVVDIDDDLSAIDPRNPAFTALHPDPHNLIPPPQHGMSPAGRKAWQEHVRRTYRNDSPHSWLAVKDAAKMATVCTVSTPALAERYGSGNTVVLPNCVPARFCDTPHVDSATIGWPGSTHSHPGDLREMGNSIAQLTGAGHRFMIVGDGGGADRDLGVPTVDETGPVPFDGWIGAVAQLGVGVAPLADTRFNAAKSWLKVLEMSAAGVPWVASPRVEYQRFASLGAGALAEKPKEWRRELLRLVTDEAWRAEQSEAGREVARAMTIEAHAWRTAEAWHLAVELERRRRAQGAATAPPAPNTQATP